MNIMGINPYATLANVAGLLGDKDTEEAARKAQETQNKIMGVGNRVDSATQRTLRTAQTGFNPHATHGAIAGRSSNSLPGIRTPQGVTGQGVNFKEKKDSKGNPIAPPFIAPVGSPSIRVTAREGGGVTTTMQRFSLYVAWISDVDWRRLMRVVQKMVRRAQTLSKGRLSLKELRKRGHPYGKGSVTTSGRKRRGLGTLTRLRGVSNLAVANIQSGELQRSWEGDIERGRLGIKVILANLSEHAEYLLGTVKMRAHGPFLTAVQLYKNEFDQLWREVTKRAYAAMLKKRGFKRAGAR